MVDDQLPLKVVGRGRKATLRDSEVVTILVFNLLTVQQQTLRQIYDWILQYHRSDFPSLPTYQNFVAHCHRVLPLLNRLPGSLLESEAKLRFMDATMLPVCKLVRRRWHRVARGVAHTGHNWQGEHYGFKLHASIDNEGRLCAYAFTSANVHDSRGPYQCSSTSTPESPLATLVTVVFRCTRR